jgi:penicillin-binding protein 1C
VTPLRPLTFQRVRFEATCDANVTTLFWFVDEELVGTSPPTEPLHWVPTVGEHTLRCVDDRGKGSSVTFRVVSDDEVVTSETVLERTAAPR